MSSSSCCVFRCQCAHGSSIGILVPTWRTFNGTLQHSHVKLTQESGKMITDCVLVFFFFFTPTKESCWEKILIIMSTTLWLIERLLSADVRGSKVVKSSPITLWRIRQQRWEGRREGVELVTMRDNTKWLAYSVHSCSFFQWLSCCVCGEGGCRWTSSRSIFAQFMLNAEY